MSFLYDTEITNWQEHQIARAGVGRKFQIPSVFRELTVRRESRGRRLPQSRRCSPISRFGFSSTAPEASTERARHSSVSSDEPDMTGRLSEPWPDAVARTRPADRPGPEGHPARRADGGHDARPRPTRPPQIINSLKGKHTLLVVEHDMALRARDRRTHHGSASRRGSGGRQHRRDRDAIRSRPRGLSRIDGDLLMLTLTNVNSFYGRSHVLHDVTLSFDNRQDHDRPRPQRRRQDDAAEDPDGH